MLAIDKLYGIGPHSAALCEAQLLVFECKHIAMKVFSLILLVAGWFLVVAAIAMLKPGFLPAFAVAGFAVEILAFCLLARAQSATRPRPERQY